MLAVKFVEPRIGSHSWPLQVNLRPGGVSRVGAGEKPCWPPGVVLGNGVRSMGRVDPRIWRRQSDAYATSSKAASLALPWLVVIHGARATSVIVQTLSGPTDGEGKEFLILPQVFWEACDGVSQQAVARELERRGHLRRTAPHFTLKERLPGFANPIRVFCVRASIFGEHDDV